MVVDRLVTAAALVLVLAATTCRSSSSETSPALSVQDGGDTRRWTAAEIAGLPTRDVAMDGHAYRGVHMLQLLDDHQLEPEEHVVAKGADGYTQTISSSAAAREDCVVAYQKDGAALPSDEGPLRIVLLGSPGLSVRNLIGLRVETR